MSLEANRHTVRNLLLGPSAASFATEAGWTKIEDAVKRWFASVKVSESHDTFEGAFRDSRMTMRAILESRQAGHYTEKVPIRGRENRAGVREIRTMQGVPGIRERMTASNFRGSGKLQRAKYEKGLFDVSAVLLNPKLSLKIGGGQDTTPPPPVVWTGPGPPPPPSGGPGEDLNQIYRTTGNTTYVFMPVPREGDMLVFLALVVEAKLSGSRGLKLFAQYMKSRFTRIKLAFEGDAGAKFIDFAPEGELLPKFRYGFGNLLSENATTAEIDRRKIQATQYKQVLLSNKRNEIILAYRQHGELARQPSAFPMFARGVFARSATRRGELDHKGYVVVDENMEKTGHVITLKGRFQSGSIAGLGGTEDLYPR